MARAVQSSSTFIDLTGDDDNDDSVARAHAACQKVFAAASRLSNHFESLKPPKPIAYRRPSETVDLTKKNSRSSTIPQPLTLPRPGTSPKPARFETEGPQVDEKRNAIPRSNSSVSTTAPSLPQSTLRLAASRPAGSPPILERTEGNKQRSRETTSITPRTDAFAIRTPRSAAISAKQNIAEACSELEDWVNKDPKVISRQPGVSTPRRPGKPNDDLDEWSPNTNTKYKEEEEKEVGRTFTGSPTLSAEKQEFLTAKGENSLYSTSGVSTSLGMKKRRFSGSPQSRGSPVKVARWGEKPNAHYEPTPPSSAEPPNRFTAPKYESDLKASGLERNLPSKSTVKMNNESSAEPSNVGSEKNGASAKAPILHTQEKIDPRPQSGFREASDPTTPELGLYQASLGHNRYSALFDSVVYPAIKKSKKRHKASLPEEDLDAIGKTVSLIPCEWKKMSF